MIRVFIAKILSVLLSLTLFYSCYAAAYKPWTLFVYMIVDQDTDVYAEQVLANMMQVGSTDVVHVLACVAQRSTLGKTKVRNLYFEQNLMQQSSSTVFSSADDVAICTQALSWVSANYPSDHLMISLWDRSGTLTFSDTQLHDLFSWASTTLNSGIKLDLVFADMSSMATLNNAFSLSNSVIYYVASEIPVARYVSFDYATMIHRMTNDNPTGFDLSNIIVDVYQQIDKQSSSYQLSTCYLSELPTLQANVNECAAYLLQRLNSNAKYWVRQGITKSIKYSVDCGNGYVDLLSWYKRISRNAQDMHISLAERDQLQLYTLMGQSFVQKVVLRSITSSDYVSSGGVSLYCPAQGAIDGDFDNSYYAQHNVVWSSLFAALKA